MTPEKTVYQILCIGKYSYPTLHMWTEDKNDADQMLEFAKIDFPNSEFWIEEGTEHIHIKCRGCGDIHVQERHDAYGISTAYWCDDCYDDPTKYHYRKDKYFDPLYAGERLEDDY